MLTFESFSGVNNVLPEHRLKSSDLIPRDVARRLAVENFVAFAPDALTPLGGYPGNDDAGRTLQQQRNGAEMQEDFIAAAE